MIEKNIISFSLLSKVRLLIDAGNIKQAKNIARKIKEIDISKYYVAKSYIDEAEGNISKAIDNANKAYETLMKKKDPMRMVDVKIESFIKEISIIPDQIVIDRFAYILYKHEKYKEAELYFDILYHLFPYEKKYLRAFIDCMIKNGKKRLPIKYIEKYLSSIYDPKKNIHYIVIYINLLLEVGDHRKALVIADSLLEALDENDFLLLAGKVYLYNKIDNKEKILNLINRLGKPTSQNWEMKGMLYLLIEDSYEREAINAFLRSANIAYFTPHEKGHMYFDAQRLFAKAAEIAFRIGDKKSANFIIKRASSLIPQFKNQYLNILKLKFKNSIFNISD